jgi:hypothetical protein
MRRLPKKLMRKMNNEVQAPVLHFSPRVTPTSHSAPGAILSRQTLRRLVAEMID